MCGGTDVAGLSMLGRAGLSPRVRGNLVLAAAGGNGVGSIPACAGEPTTAGPFTRRWTVYPRVCGGTSHSGHCRLCHPGLSPRVRGNQSGPAPHFLRVGSIPACAGEPIRTPAGRSTGKVYPRVCGGTNQRKGNRTLEEGLSPRVRGNLQVRIGQSVKMGSIPACAGEPFRVVPRSEMAQVYPRVCGGTSMSSAGVDKVCGLSPRVRGNPLNGGVVGRVGRSIPACAGEPVQEMQRLPIRWVYPRVCGGTNRSPSRTLWEYGLSPRVRGNPCRRWRSPTDARSIPACAGEPGRR